MYNCLIVDDEPIAREIIITYCSHFPLLHIKGSCGNVFEAKNMLQQESIDILFLDVHMPVLDGIGFLKTLKQRPQVIFTTAYKEYATDAFDLAACDYLVKPFSLERFMQAVDKAQERVQGAVQPVIDGGQKEDNYFFIKADGKIFKLNYEDILLAEAQGNYTKIICIDNTLSTNMSFSSFEALLPAFLFVRVHRSYIINKSKITHIEGNTVYIQKIPVPVGVNHKESFLKAIGL